MISHNAKFGNWMVLVILIACASFFTGCLGTDEDSEITANTPAGVMNLQISGSILDPADTAEGFLNAAANSAVLRLIAFDASKNYIDVIDCATGNSVGTGSIAANGTFTVQVDIRANAGKTIMLVIGLKTADGSKGLQIYKCLLGRMPKATEIPDSTAMDSVKITDVDVSFESTAKALFAMEKGLDKDPAEPFFSVSTSEVQAGKTVSKSFSTDNAFQKKIESESGGAENVAQVASAVRALAILAASNVSDTLKSDILQGPVQNASEALNTYSRLIAQSDDQSVSTIITQNLIPTELKLSTAGGTTVVNGNSTASTNKDAVTGIAAASINDTPVFNIKDGEYSSAQTISMSTNTAGAVIYYTLDGSSPSESFGIKYETPFSISMSAQIKAAAFKSGSVASPAACLNLSIKLPASSVENFYYRVENAGITITYYRGTDVNVTIPDTIDGKPVVTIGNGAFCTSNLTSIVMPDSVTSIQSIAFFNCQALESVTLSKNITNIDLSAFSGCTSLKNIILPDSLTSIGNSAFSRCPNLTSVTLPENLTSIGNHSFFSCTGLKKIIIPGKVNSIGSNAFGSCSSMYDITIPASVNSMGDGLSNFRNVYFEGDIPTFTNTSGNYNFGARVIFYYLANKKGWTTRPNNQPAASYDINSSKIRIPNSGSFKDTDYNAKKISGTISWTAIDPAEGILGYHIYWGKDMRVADSNRTGDKLSDNAEILYTVAGAAATSQKVPINTSIPEGAKCFLIYSFDANGDSAARCAVAIKDIVKPIPTVLPTNGRFTDTDINVSKISGNITWNPSATTESIYGYKIYFGHDATTILSGNTSEVYTVSGAAAASQTVAVNTALPAGATHFLIYPYNASGNSSLCLAVPILDLTVSSPTILATSGAFNDSDISASRISGEITWTPANPATGISGYKIYWGQNATTILSGNTSEVYTVSGAAAASQTVAANTSLPAGATHFLIYSFNANGNSAAALAVGITDNSIPAAIPTSGTFTDADIDSMEVSGNITWTPASPAIDITGYKIYWGENATTKLTGNTSEVYTVSGAAAASQTVAANTSLPAGATHFLIYSFNANGNSAAALAVAIVDKSAPTAIPTSGTFIDSDMDSTEIFGIITWTPASPVTDITGYKIFWGQNATTKLADNTSEVYTVSGADKTLQIVAANTALPAGATHFLIYSFNANGSSTSCLAVNITDIKAFKNCIYNDNGDGITITGYVDQIGMDIQLVIPDTIDGKPVVAIGDSAFVNKIAITDVVFPRSIKSIGDNAFYGCSGIKRLVFPDGITSIGANAFNYCSSLYDISFPASLTTLGNYSFGNCKNLLNVYFEGNAPLNYGIRPFYLDNEIFHYAADKTGWTTPKWMANSTTGAYNVTVTFDVNAPRIKVPASGSFTDTDYNAKKIAGNLTWAAVDPAEGVIGYNIYWGAKNSIVNSGTKLSGNPDAVYTVTGASTNLKTIAINTSIPEGADCFLIYPYGAKGDSAARLAVPIKDIVKAIPTVLPTAGSFTDTDMDSSEVSGTINWTASNPSTGITGYKIYWGQDVLNKLTGSATAIYTISGAAANSQEVAINTSVPAGATHFLIYPYNAYGDSSLCLAVPIVDNKQVATPVLAPSSMAAFYKTVTITCATPDAVIYYTTNGSEPAASNGTVYTTPFNINSTTTVKAIAFKDGMIDSVTASATYTIYYPDITPPSSPVYSPANNAAGIVLNIAPTLTFSEALYTASTAMEASPTGIIKVYEGNDNTGTALTEGAVADNVHFTVAYDSANRKFTVTFGADLKNNQSYYIELQANKVYDSSRNTISTAQGVKFTTIAPSAPAITGYTAGPGTVFGSVKVTYTAGDGNSLKYVKQAGAFTTPLLGADASAIGTAYTSGDNITGAAPTQHIGIYEINASNLVVKFVDILLAPADPITGLVIAPGSVPGSVKLTYNAGSNSLKYVKQAFPTMIPLINDDVSMISTTAYVSGSNITDAAAGECIALYEILDGTNKIVKFAGIVLLPPDIAPEYSSAPGSIVLEAGSTNQVGGITNVAIPAAGATDTTGAVTGWVTVTADKIKFTVTDAGSASSTIKINDVAYTSGNDYTIGAASTLTIIVTTTEAGKTTGVRTFTVSVTAAP